MLYERHPTALDSDSRTGVYASVVATASLVSGIDPEVAEKESNETPDVGVNEEFVEEAEDDFDDAPTATPISSSTFSTTLSCSTILYVVSGLLVVVAVILVADRLIRGNKNDEADTETGTDLPKCPIKKICKPSSTCPGGKIELMNDVGKINDVPGLEKSENVAKHLKVPRCSSCHKIAAPQVLTVKTDGKTEIVLS